MRHRLHGAEVSSQIWATERLPSVTLRIIALLLPDFFMLLPSQRQGTPPSFGGWGGGVGLQVAEARRLFCNVATLLPVCWLWAERRQTERQRERCFFVLFFNPSKLNPLTHDAVHRLILPTIPCWSLSAAGGTRRLGAECVTK